MTSRSKQPATAAKDLILTSVFTLKGHTKFNPSISYFPDGKRMISGSRDGTVRRWDLEAGKEIEEARDVGMQGVYAVAVSRDGQRLVMGGGLVSIGNLRVCEVDKGIVRRFHSWHSGIIICIDISPDSALLASGSYKTLEIWSLDTGKIVATFKIDDWVGAVRFSQHSKKIAVISNAICLEVWDIQKKKLDVRTCMWGRNLIRSKSSAPLFWTTDDKTIVAALRFSSSDSESPNTIYEFDAYTLKTVGTPFKGHTKTINGLALSFDCALLASCSDDHTIKLWAFDSRQLLASYHILDPHFIIFSPDSRQLAYTAGENRNRNIYLCNTPPEILGSIQPTQQVPQRVRSHSRTYPINMPLANLPNSEAARRRDPTIGWAGAQTPGKPPWRTAMPPFRGGGWTETRTIRYAGTSRIQPAYRRPPTDMWRQCQYYDSALQSLPQDFPYAIGEPVPALPGPPRPFVTSLPPPTQRPSPALSSPLPELPSYPCEVPTPPVDPDTFLPIRNHESGSFPPETRLKNLTGYITKDGDYPVARGGFGEIWKCTYHNDDQRLIQVAVKSLQVYAADQLGPAKTKKIKRITRELRICANLKHKNILPIYGFTNGFGPFKAIVSPWAENGNLTAYLEREGANLTPIRRCQMLRDIIAGLRYLHANNVIHGDFNGPNVLIHGDGTACVADFGLSLMYSEVISASQASWTSTPKGNTRWMAPELLVPEQEDGSPTRPSKQSDIFSFGGITLQVLTNKIPYYYLPNDAAIVLCIAKSEKPSRPRYPVLLEKYWQFIEKCWSTDPRDRPSTEGADGVIRNELYSLSRSP